MRWGRGGGVNYEASIFERIISLDNLFKAWEEFRQGKKKRSDLMEFQINLEDHVYKLHEDLKNNNYRHGGYFSFIVHDPKRRHIHKASVRDRLLHHAIVRIIEPMFERTFIFDSWSCRKDKGTHKAVDRLQYLARKVSRNNSINLWTLKLDIQKFFDSVDHEVLLRILDDRIHDIKTMRLLTDIVESFSPGMPLGNLTSQLFANVYMNELDQYIKHDLKVKGYLRYSDDFVLLHKSKEVLQSYIPLIKKFVEDKLHLIIHERKIILGKYRSGLDFLGYVSFPYHRVIRTRTKKRMLRKITKVNFASYSGQLSHSRSTEVRKKLIKELEAQRQAAKKLKLF